MLLLLLVVFVSTSAVRIYEQCGGEGWRGGTVCDPPLRCFRRSKWFSSCQMACPGGDWECSSISGASTGAGAQPWDQCGGEGWRGATWCIQYACRARSQYYSQCRPDCPDGWLCSGSPTPIATPSSSVPTTTSVSVTAGTSTVASSTSPLLTTGTVFPETSPSVNESITGEFNETTVDVGEEIIDIEGLDELMPYDPSEFDGEELGTDEFADPSELDLDELQQEEEGMRRRRRKRRQSAAVGSSCEANGIEGVCRSTSSCAGESVPGHCPGSVDIQCCIVEEETYGSCQVNDAEGICRDVSSCVGGTSHPGKCPGAANIQCCIKKTSTAPTSTASTSSGQLCGSYVGESTFMMEGNGQKQFQVVKIKREHLSNPNSYSLASTKSDNTMTVNTACAFDKMASAAKKSGVTLLINSGFRVLERQKYFYGCYQTKKCNKGRKAAVPGTSNHGIGRALDILTACGGQTGATAPAACMTHANGVYKWLYNNAQKFGFTRTVKSEPWHWEFRGVGVPRASFS